MKQKNIQENPKCVQKYFNGASLLKMIESMSFDDMHTMIKKYIGVIDKEENISIIVNLIANLIKSAEVVYKRFDYQKDCSNFCNALKDDVITLFQKNIKRHFNVSSILILLDKMNKVALEIRYMGEPAKEIGLFFASISRHKIANGIQLNRILELISKDDCIPFIEAQEKYWEMHDTSNSQMAYLMALKYGKCATFFKTHTIPNGVQQMILERAGYPVDNKSKMN